MILGCIIEKGISDQILSVCVPYKYFLFPKIGKVSVEFLVFSYYSQWIHCYSEKIRPLPTVSSFPIPMEAKTAFETLKKDIEQSVLCSIDEHVPFEVETDPSEFAITATLNQNGRPVAFSSRTLQGAEIRHTSIEKEAQAIIEMIRHRKLTLRESTSP